ncbi:MAG: glycosyltransferase family 4 protein [Bacteroidota bacterium]
MADRINIIIPTLGSSSWTGGFTYQSNLIEALRKREDVRIYLVSNLEGKSSSPIEGGSLDVLFSRIKRNYRAVTFKLSMLFNGFDKGLSKRLKRFDNSSLNALFTLNHAHLFSKNNILKLYWIPDFQHIHLSYLFKKEEIVERNLRFLEGCKHADVIIVSSQNAKKDLARFAPEFLHKSRVSNFVSNVPENIWEKDPSILTSKYGIPEKFFYLPNQFWKHKNHITVLEALRKLKQKGVSPQIVFTGNPTDYRNPEYIEELKKYIRDWGLSDQLFILGMVDHDDVLLLIRQCIAIINPSLFEGWSTTVEESKSIGKRAILSDIEVHREQHPAVCDFFKPKDSDELSLILEKRWCELNSGPDIIMETQAREDLVKRISAYGDNFIQIIKDFSREKSEKEHDS